MLFTRRRVFGSLLGVVFPFACELSADESQTDPWSAQELLPTQSLAKALELPAERPTIICVAFPVLYRQKHIVGAKFAGPGSKIEGIAALKEAVAPLSHDAAIVLYCGCCPIARCPNVRPAFRTLKELDYKNVRVLNLASNFRTDWEEKGYPVSSRS